MRLDPIDDYSDTHGATDSDYISDDTRDDFDNDDRNHVFAKDFAVGPRHA
jgi:hypothetical protein